MSIAFDGETNGIGLKMARLKKRIKKRKIAELDTHSLIYLTQKKNSLIYTLPKDTQKKREAW